MLLAYSEPLEPVRLLAGGRALKTEVVYSHFPLELTQAPRRPAAVDHWIWVPPLPDRDALARSVSKRCWECGYFSPRHHSCCPQKHDVHFERPWGGIKGGEK